MSRPNYFDHGFFPDFLLRAGLALEGFLRCPGATCFDFLGSSFGGCSYSICFFETIRGFFGGST